MKINYLTQAVSISLATLALTACGGGDDTPIYGVQDTPSPVVPTITPTETTPEVTPVTPAPTPATPNFVELAKQAGLTDTNATIFAETARNMTVGSQEYQNALAQAIEAQKSADAIKINSDGNSPVVDKANPFIKSIDVSKTATVGSSHYVRQLGSNYERTSNPEAIAALGSVATEEPTNPWLSNYVLGVEAIRQADGTYKMVAIDSAGEMVVSAGLANKPNQGRKLGGLLGADAGYSGDPTVGSNALTERTNRLLASTNTDSPYYGEEYNGLLYKTQRLDGDSALYDYGNYTTNNPAGRTESNLGAGATNQVRTLQEMNSQHHTRPRTELVTNALKAAQNKNYNQFPDNPNLQNQPTAIANGTTLPNRGGTFVEPALRNSFGDYTRSGLIVYNDDSKEVGLEKGRQLGYKMPSWGREENVYIMNDETGELEVINGVDVTRIRSNINANTAAVTLTTIPPSQPISSRAAWNAARYGSLESRPNENFNPAAPPYNSALPISATNQPSSFFYNHEGQVITKTSDQTGKNHAFDYAVPVANNDSIRLFGKNMLGYDAGAEGEQTHNNTYTATYNPTTGLMSSIVPDKLHHVQYGRLTNNIDLIHTDSITDKPRVLYRDFQPHGAPNTVDTYFYRGTGHTSLEQMANIKVQGGSYRYFGHALTYNLGPYVNTAEVGSGSVPTAYGSEVNMSSGNTIGNFVEATFDAGKATVNGTIYNFINHDVAKDENNFIKQTLASFKGDVFGNTVVGTANKTGTNEVGSLTASFFGEGAREMGGQISSISREQGYGDPKWGAVFGATRGTSITNYSAVEK